MTNSRLSYPGLAAELLSLRGAIRLASSGHTFRADVLEALARSEALAPSAAVRRAWAPDDDGSRTTNLEIAERTGEHEAYIALRVAKLKSQRETRSRQRMERLAAQARSAEAHTEHVGAE